MLAEMARNGVADGRPMVVFVFADCDPAGYQMATSIGHKLRAFRDSQHPELDFRVVVPALTVEQVGALGLPSTPLKETERRASRWRAAYGVEQTEIDALATLRPDELRRIVRRAVKPYWDPTLEDRAREATGRMGGEGAGRLRGAGRRRPDGGAADPGRGGGREPKGTPC